MGGTRACLLVKWDACFPEVSLNEEGLSTKNPSPSDGVRRAPLSPLCVASATTHTLRATTTRIALYRHRTILCALLRQLDAIRLAVCVAREICLRRDARRRVGSPLSVLSCATARVSDLRTALVSWGAGWNSNRFGIRNVDAPCTVLVG